MYSKNEAALIKKEFWTSLGTYLKPVLSANGQKVNWVNYKTGIKGIYFRTDVTKREASVAVELTHPGEEKRTAAFDKLVSLKAVFSEMAGGDWLWQRAVYDEEGRPVSKILIRKEPVNIFNRNDWPVIISFFKQHLIALDAFWSIAKAYFED
ncbi:DUF4268 domain-containing protein [Niabella drilacis]|uniref:DUF4268 domain-containing protein n=1 Tax=Niabella drilacis (strain DSM 25811 / CCM 8410 / CCUG 62505 / LMG 26954 / E90) TaxID=1285928 RepID=A0A1G6J372_NIADE|nr:DUF4268 domain-containing protein [Niabella drilacis]SDC12456.1 protein of unknown function [Niabella drilacis]